MELSWEKLSVTSVHNREKEVAIDVWLFLVVHLGQIALADRVALRIVPYNLESEGLEARNVDWLDFIIFVDIDCARKYTSQIFQIAVSFLGQEKLT